jgi:hypothetical protein
VRAIDFDHPHNNTFTVTNQLEVLGDRDKIIPDFVVYVNGQFQLREALLQQQKGDETHGLQAYERPFFDLLREVLPVEDGLERTATLARETTALLAQLTVIDWTTREDVKREMRRQVKDLLRAEGMEHAQIDPLAKRIVALAEHWLKG